MLRGGTEAPGGVEAIPTSSRVACGQACGVRIPPRTPRADPSTAQGGAAPDTRGVEGGAVPDTRGVVWAGPVSLGSGREEGGGESVRVTLHAGEAREEALARAFREAEVDSDTPPYLVL